MESEKQVESPSDDFKLGCAHYKRKSKFVTPCCDKVYSCRFCHDDNESHILDRKTVTELVCCGCQMRQKVQEKCESCSISFGKYVCLECRLFDDVDKEQYHCKGCGICRVGGQDNFFHCHTCNMCLPKSIKDTHKCLENVSRSDCPVCLEDLHTSRMPCHIPPCSHLIHKKCQEEMFRAGVYACPLCQVSLLDMSKLWASLDEDILKNPMPKEYKDKIVDILCKDCHKKSSVSFHFLGMKCSHCGSYNTC